MDDRSFAQCMLTQCVAGRTHQIARIVSARYDQAMKPYGLTSNQMTLLCLVALLQPTTSSSMLPYLKMEQSTLSRNLERLVAKEWLERSPGKDDSRTTCLSLTAAGSAKLREGRAGWDKAQAWAAEALGDASIVGLNETAHRLNPLMPKGD